MPKFLTRAEVYRLLQRELPEGAYPDGQEDAFYSTADMASVAACAASGYTNLERIYENYWPQSANERLLDWQILAFAKLLSSGLSVAEQQDRITQKIRSRKGLTVQDMKDIVLSVIGSDKLVDVIEWNCSSGGWMIGVSQLSINTFLNGYRMVDAVGPNLCEQTPADFGLTEEQWQGMREQAYTYEIRIYGYTLSANEYTEIDETLSVYEPARSQHKITDGLDPNDQLDGDTVFVFGSGAFDVSALS